MKPAASLALLLASAATLVAARYSIATNVANVRAIRASGGAMERPRLDRFAIDCDQPGSPVIAMAGAKLLRGCAAGALGDLQAFLRMHPDDPVALTLSGDAEWQLKHPERARASWASAGDYRRLVGAGHYLERVRNVGSAESMYSAAAEVPSTDETAGMALAALRWNHGNKNGAAQAYEAMIARDPRRGGDLAYSNLGTLYAERKQFREADAIIERGMALWPGSVSLRTTRGMVYAASGRTDLAAATLRRVWTENPGAAVACFWLGWTREHQGDDRAAVHQYSACLARNPGDVSARYERGAAHMRLGDLASARADFLAIPPADPLHRWAADRLREIERDLR
jgi:tetratricopeptide (TPR) repeat protein